MFCRSENRSSGSPSLSSPGDGLAHDRSAVASPDRSRFERVLAINFPYATRDLRRKTAISIATQSQHHSGGRVAETEAVQCGDGRGTAQTARPWTSSHEKSGGQCAPHSRVHTPAPSRTKQRRLRQSFPMLQLAPSGPRTSAHSRAASSHDPESHPVASEQCVVHAPSNPQTALAHSSPVRHGSPTRAAPYVRHCPSTQIEPAAQSRSVAHTGAPHPGSTQSSQTPRMQTEPSSQRTAAHGSTQLPYSQTWPGEHVTPSQLRGG
ncbi:Hypothetical protein I5071_6540 [Sandaracinus amylolyticus]|nr:Hypothetical protein I5071_6540 [Sandaracinus amylolyticus]